MAAVKAEKKRDRNCICVCGGNYVPIGEEGGLKVFHCDSCWRGGQIECPVCRKPRTLFDREKNMCKICSGALKAETEMIVAKASNQLFERLVNEVKRTVKLMYGNALKRTITTN